MLVAEDIKKKAVSIDILHRVSLDMLHYKFQRHQYRINELCYELWQFYGTNYDELRNVESGDGSGGSDEGEGVT